MAVIVGNETLDNTFWCERCDRKYAVALLTSHPDIGGKVEEVVCRDCWQLRAETLRRFAIPFVTQFLDDVRW